MPFKSKSQWRQCFAAARRGQRNINECREFARMTKSYESLPEKVKPKTKQSRGRRVMRSRRKGRKSMKKRI